MNKQKDIYLMNAWYVAALSTEVEGEALFSRTLLDTRVMMYRKQDGTAGALWFLVDLDGR